MNGQKAKANRLILSEGRTKRQLNTAKREKSAKETKLPRELEAADEFAPPVTLPVPVGEFTRYGHPVEDAEAAVVIHSNGYWSLSVNGKSLPRPRSGYFGQSSHMEKFEIEINPINELFLNEHGLSAAGINYDELQSILMIHGTEIDYYSGRN